MANNNYTPAQTGFSRLFNIDGRARPDHKPEYFSSLKMTGLSQALGDVTKIEMPDPNKYGEFIEVGQTRGAKDRVSTSLVGRYAIALKSKLMQLAMNSCPIDVQLHFGACQDPSSFQSFSKATILEDVLPTNYSTEDLGALASDEMSKVDETLEISAKDMYEVVPLSFSLKAGDVITKEAVDVIIADTPSCGTCASESDGAKKFFVLTKAESGSPSTPADVVFSIDKGLTWHAADVDTLLAAQEPSAIGALGDYIYVLCNVAKSISYALKSEFDGIVDPSFTELANYATGPNATATYGAVGMVVCNGGYIYKLENVATAPTLLDAGANTSSNLLDVHMLSQDYAIVGGQDGTILYTVDGANFSLLSTSPVGIGTHINAVWMKSATEWWVGTSGGKLYYTLNGGLSWTEKALPGTGPTAITDIVFAKPSVAYVSATVGGKGRMYRSIDGGYSWAVMPESGTFPSVNAINAIAANGYDPNLVVGAGLAADGSDGAILLGKG